MLFQSEGCRVLELDSTAQELLKVYLLNFVKADIVNESDDVTTINYSSPSNYKSDDAPKNCMATEDINHIVSRSQYITLNVLHRLPLFISLAVIW